MSIFSENDLYKDWREGLNHTSALKLFAQRVANTTWRAAA